MNYVTHENDLYHSNQNTDREPLHVLVVEDDMTLKKVIMRSLRMVEQNIKVEWATSADQFFLSDCSSKRSGDKSFDLVLTDINMPGTNSGLQVWNHFKLLDPTIPVVIMSGISESDFRRRIGDIPSVHYVQKPFNLEKCAAVLNLCNRGNQGNPRQKSPVRKSGIA